MIPANPWRAPCGRLPGPRPRATGARQAPTGLGGGRAEPRCWSGPGERSRGATSRRTLSMFRGDARSGWPILVFPGGPLGARAGRGTARAVLPGLGECHQGDWRVPARRRWESYRRQSPRWNNHRREPHVSSHRYDSRCLWRGDTVSLAATGVLVYMLAGFQHRLVRVWASHSGVNVEDGSWVIEWCCPGVGDRDAFAGSSQGCDVQPAMPALGSWHGVCKRRGRHIQTLWLTAGSVVRPRRARMWTAGPSGRRTSTDFRIGKGVAVFTESLKQDNGSRLESGPPGVALPGRVVPADSRLAAPA